MFGPTQNGRQHFIQELLFLVHFFKATICPKNMSGSTKLVVVKRNTSWLIQDYLRNIVVSTIVSLIDSNESKLHMHWRICSRSN